MSEFPAFNSKMQGVVYDDSRHPDPRVVYLESRAYLLPSPPPTTTTSAYVYRLLNLRLRLIECGSGTAPSSPTLFLSYIWWPQSYGCKPHINSSTYVYLVYCSTLIYLPRTVAASVTENQGGKDHKESLFCPCGRVIVYSVSTT